MPGRRRGLAVADFPEGASVERGLRELSLFTTDDAHANSHASQLNGLGSETPQ